LTYFISSGTFEVQIEKMVNIYSLGSGAVYGFETAVLERY